MMSLPAQLHVPAVHPPDSEARRFIRWRGERLSIVEWAERLDLDPAVLLHRRARNWSLERMFTTPTRFNFAEGLEKQKAAQRRYIERKRRATL